MIDWEQRRYELVRDIMRSWPWSSTFAEDIKWSSGRVVEIADTLIEQLRKDALAVEYRDIEFQTSVGGRSAIEKAQAEGWRLIEVDYKNNIAHLKR